MIPFGTKTVTLYHRENGTISRHVLRGCSWRVMESRSLYDGAMKPSTRTICRYTRDQQRARAGDIMILGECLAEPTSAVQFAEIIEAHADTGSFIVETFADNDGVNAHFCARGA